MAGAELVGVQDIAPESLERAVAAGTIAPDQGYTELSAMLGEIRPDALIVCPIHSEHAAAAGAGLAQGCHVLVEKPFVTELADAVRLTAEAEQQGLVLGVVQNWRTKSAGLALRRAIQDELVGEVSHIFFRYLRDRELPHLPDYLFEEADPILHAMAIHHFDLFRYALGQEIVSVDGHAARPAWSRYSHPSLMQLWLETDGGVVISYVATFSSRNAHLPKESLQVEGEHGTLVNESEYFEPPLLLSRRGQETMEDLTANVRAPDRGEQEQYALGDVEILRNWLAAIRGEEQLVAPARDNLGTLAVIEAARQCLASRHPVDPRALLEGAFA